MADWKRDDTLTRKAMQPWAYWLLYKTGLLRVEWHGQSTFRDKWPWD